MNLANKIMNLRRQNGWSQEDLAEKLGISRQSVSKWESNVSIPDIDKIVKMSTIFGVSTDYLLKDENDAVTLVVPVYEEREEASEKTDYEEAGDDFSEESFQSKDVIWRNVSYEEVMEFLEVTASAAKGIAVGVTLCIMGAAFLVAMVGFVESPVNNSAVFLTEELTASLGVVILLLFCAVGVVFIVSNGMKINKYEYFEKETLYLEDDAEKIVKKKKAEFEPVYRNCIVAGVALCIMAVIPLILASGIDMGESVLYFCVALLLIIVSCAVFLFVWSGNIRESYSRVLQEGEYTVENKLLNRKTGWLSSIYWCLVVGAYLYISFTYKNWESSWIIWPVAAMLHAAVRRVVKEKVRKNL